MQEGDGGVDEERVAGDAGPDDPIGGLVEAAPREDGQQLRPPVEGYLEQHRDQPQDQRRQEERPGPVLAPLAAPRPRHSPARRLSSLASERALLRNGAGGGRFSRGCQRLLGIPR